MTTSTDKKGGRAFTPARIVALVVIGLLVLGLGYIHVASGDDAVSVPSGAKSRDATDEEDARPALLPAGFDARLYLGSAAFLLLCAAAVALALAAVGATLLAPQPPLLHQPPHRGVRRHRNQRWILLGERP